MWGREEKLFFKKVFPSSPTIMSKFDELRSNYPAFIYHSYDIDEKGFSFRFTIGEYEFTPSWEWGSLAVPADMERGLIEYIIFSIGMTELVSYWKCACPPKVIVKCGSLTGEQIQWWKKLYFNGLGEFFYRNGIDTDIDSFMTVEAKNTAPVHFSDPFRGERKGALIPVGGGKDSIVTLELLKGMKADNLCYIINPRKTTLDCAHTAGYDDSGIIGLKRSIHPELLKRNADGWLNGHTPFSAIVAFSSYLAAVVTGKKYIALSNESSANEGNVSGTGVNHQYSKSTGFEKDFREYCEKWFTVPPEYFSLLRPWSEWQIAKRFVTFPRYLPVFRSCNLGSKTDSWCGKCAKCLYVYIMLAAFLDDSELVKIFGSDMLDNTEFEGLFKGLVCADFDKPFECVGTRAEIQLALYRAYIRRKGGKLPALLAGYIGENPGAPENLDLHYDADNFVPAELSGLLKNDVNSFAEKLRGFFEHKNVLILGYGREGASTLAHIRDIGIDCGLAVADRNELSADRNPELSGMRLITGEDYLGCLDEFDIIMKAPGIALFDRISDSVKAKITCQTDLLLRFCPNRVIGITGTKGKSTTSSLIYHILKSSGKNAQLIGNIGIPPLDCLYGLKDDDILVCEMSCHQLEYVRASPDIAVYVNLFEEHLDHYTGFDAYRLAKENIYKFQTGRDILIVNKDIAPENAESFTVTASLDGGADICVSADGKPVIFGTPYDVTTKLLGRHNIYNIGIAMYAAKLCGLDPSEMAAAAATFEGLPHRLEYVGTVNGADYINDSISTCPSTAIAAASAAWTGG